MQGRAASTNQAVDLWPDGVLAAAKERIKQFNIAQSNGGDSSEGAGRMNPNGGRGEMKTAFQILKDRPKIPIVMTRDSVCAGDDCDAPHQKKFEVYSFLDPEAFTRAASSEYLPSVAGVGHTWTCKVNGVSVAEVGLSGIRSLVRETPFSDENHVHFEYHSAAF